MKLKSTYRILFITGAFALGVLIVFLLSVAGNKSKGPLQNLLGGIEKSILDAENTLIISKREDQRKEKLGVFNQ